MIRGRYVNVIECAKLPATKNSQDGSIGCGACIRSHLPERGPFSICMHRSDAATVSYMEVAVSGQRATMRYKPGPCCSNGAMMTKTISLAR